MASVALPVDAVLAAARALHANKSFAEAVPLLEALAPANAEACGLLALCYFNGEVSVVLAIDVLIIAILSNVWICITDPCRALPETRPRPWNTA